MPEPRPRTYNVTASNDPFPSAHDDAVWVKARTTNGEVPRIIVAKNRRKMHELGSFVMASQRFLDQLATHPDLAGKAPLQLFIFLLSRQNYQNTVTMSATDIGTCLSLNPRDVRRAFRQLESSGFVKRDPTAKKTGTATYRLNPFAVARGKSESVLQAQTDSPCVRIVVARPV